MWGPQDLLMSPSCGHGGLVCSQLTHPNQTSVSPSCALAVDNACRGLSCAAVLSMPVPLLSSEGGQVCLLLVWSGTSPMSVGAPPVLGAELTHLTIQVHHRLS